MRLCLQHIVRRLAGIAWDGLNLEATVTAWMPLPEPYKAEVEERPDAYADWQDHYMDRFEKVE